RAGGRIVAEGLRIVGIRVETTLGVEAFGSVGRVGGTGPLDAAPAAKAVVGQRAVVARPASRAVLPRGECRFGVVPGDERVAVAVAEVHSSRVVEEDVEIGPRVAGW